MPSTHQVQEAFPAVDEMRLDDFAALFTPDGTMTFGNGEPTVGPEANKRALGDFYRLLQGVRHEVRGAWIVDAEPGPRDGQEEELSRGWTGA